MLNRLSTSACVSILLGLMVGGCSSPTTSIASAPTADSAVEAVQHIKARTDLAPTEKQAAVQRVVDSAQSDASLPESEKQRVAQAAQS